MSCIHHSPLAISRDSKHISHLHFLSPERSHPHFRGCSHSQVRFYDAFRPYMQYRRKYSHYTIQALHLFSQFPQNPAVFMGSEDPTERKAEPGSQSPFKRSLPSSMLVIKQASENHLANLTARSYLAEEVFSKTSTQDFLHKDQLPTDGVRIQTRVVYEDMLRHCAKHSRNTEQQKNFYTHTMINLLNCYNYYHCSNK